MKGMKRIKTAACVLAAALCLILTGCSAFENIVLTNKKETSGDGRTYTVYYANTSKDELVGKEYKMQAVDFNGMLKELIGQFEFAPTNDVVSALPADLKLNDVTLGVDNITVDFAPAYLELSNTEEILLRAGLVKTLVQLPGIYRVAITVEGQPFVEEDGRQVSALNENSFIDSENGGINAYHFTTLNLYFPSKAGNTIIREMRNVFYTGQLDTAKAVVDQIIAGPVNKQLRKATRKACQANSVTVEEGICHIDFNEVILNRPRKVTTPEAIVYAFTNAIFEADDSIKGVRMTVNGSSEPLLGDTLSLNQTFVRNAQIIEEIDDNTEPLTEIFLNGEIAERNEAEKEAKAQEEAAASAQVEKTDAAESGVQNQDNADSTQNDEAVEEAQTEKEQKENRGKSAGDSVATQVLAGQGN